MLMNENILRDILLEVHEIECGVSDDLPDFKPSLRHRLAMKRIFARFDRNMRKLRNTRRTVEAPTIEHRTRRYNIKQRVLIATLIIVLMAFLAGCASAIVKFVSEHFNGKVNEDNTQLFVINLDNCPQTIEYQYVLTNIPDGFELIETTLSPTNTYTLYLNSSTGQYITLQQSVKTYFFPHYNTEKNKFEEINIKDTITVLFLDLSIDKQDSWVLIWDNGDYIIEISADLDKNSALNLLNITKI